MRTRVWIVGVGMTPFGVYTDHINHDLARWAVCDALADADAGADKDRIDAAFYGTATHGFLEGQVAVSGQITLRGMGIENIPIHNVENACATGASAFNLAVTHVRAGEADVALAVGSEKMHVGDQERTVALFNGGYDVSDPDALTRTLEELGGEIDASDLGHRSIFMDIYAAMARNHMRAYGTTQEQIAAVAAKNHAHAVDNPRAHFRKGMSIEDVLSARRLAYPLTVPMCAPVTDGAAAVVVCNDEGLRRLGAERPVQVLASVIGTGSDRDITTFDTHIGKKTAARAYDQPGVSPEGVDVAEVHDATAFGEVVQTELLGLVAPGEGGAAALRGDTSLGGRILSIRPEAWNPRVTPSGPPDWQIFELTEQLRGTAGPRQVPGARIALAENGGGFHRGEEAVRSITLLGSR